MQNSIGSDFFSGKRPWSKIKDEILFKYLPPYLRKVKLLRKKIILIDGFAGPGKFDDGSFGSPYMFCSLAKQYVGNNFKVILVNKEKKYHDQLSTLLNDYIKDDFAITINGTAADLLERLKDILKKETVFVYLDQFGVSGFKFETLLPYLTRSKLLSTELLLNINVPVIHRLSAKNATTDNNTLKKWRDTLTEVFGGDYWKDSLYDDSLDANAQINELMNTYKAKLEEYLDYVGFCPVYEKGKGSTLKYYIFFASRHIDAALLLNDIMFNAYWKHIWDCSYKDTLFQNEGLNLNLPCDYYTELKGNIIRSLKENNCSRIDLWKLIVTNNFMKFKSSDFKNEVRKLVTQKKLNFIDVKQTGRLNDQSILMII